MQIGRRRISPNDDVYIIAELGVNHDGDAARAIDLTRAAAAAGADAIKLQYFETDQLMSRAAKLAAYQCAAGESDPVSMLRRLELPLGAMRGVVDQAHELKLHAIVTVFSVGLVEAAASLPWDAYKVASPDIINRPLLDAVARTGKPMIVSTGAATAREVLGAYLWLSGIEDRLAFLQCVSAYPTPIEHAAIGGMLAIESLTGCPVGYSDHTSGVTTGALARRWGASILEKHLTYDTAAAGPDHAASLDPGAFAEYVSLAREVIPLDVRERGIAMQMGGPNMVGVGEARKQVFGIEEDVRTVSRQSLTLTRDVPAGHRLCRADLTIKRPGTGLPPHMLSEVVGLRIRTALGADTPLVADSLVPMGLAVPAA